MNRSLWRKCISESAILFVAIALGVFSFAWFRVHIVGEVDTSSFQKILALIPEKWLNFTAVDVEWLISYVGRTALALDEPFLIMMIAIWAIVRGSDVVSGEISRGTMEMLLAQPISRKQAFVVHSFVTVLGVLALVSIVWLGMWLAIHMTDVKVVPETSGGWQQTLGPLAFLMPQQEVELISEPMSEHVRAAVFFPGLANLFFLGCFIAGLASLFSAFDRFRWRTLGAVVAIYMVAAMIKILGMSSETFQWAEWFTFFSLYEPELSIKLCETDPSAFWQLMRFDEAGQWVGFGQLGHNLLLGCGALLFFVTAYRVFKKRDIPAPL
ncbi:MAG: ABC transporter permease subunit [Pirellulaceae bacterium]|nr:ABC transporter permease subunit [Pirellulaceae bacterium]